MSGARLQARSDPCEPRRRIVEYDAGCQVVQRTPVALVSDGGLTTACSGRRCAPALMQSVGPHVAAGGDTMKDSDLLEVLKIYFEAFAERDAARRGELLAQCLTPDCAIWGHSKVFAGHAAISEKIAGFHRSWPDCRLVLASGLMTFDNIARFANAIVRRDGSVVARGETVSEVAPDGRLLRIVPLWEMSLPPVPDSWPAHLAMQPLPKASDTA